MSNREAFGEEKPLNAVYVGKWDELPRVNTHQCQIDIEGELQRKNENRFGDQDKFFPRFEKNVRRGSPANN